MKSHLKAPAQEQDPTYSSGETEASPLSTHEVLLQQRRTEVYASSIKQHHRTIKDFKKIVAGDTIVKDLEAFAIDIPLSSYERDYAELVSKGYFKAEPVNRLIEVRPIPRDNTLAERQADVREILRASPFRQQLSVFTDELDALVQLSPEPGVYELVSRLDETNDVDQQVASVLNEKESLRINTKDSIGVVEVIIQDETKDEQERYIHTDSARAFLGALDSAGIALTEKAKRELTVESDHRYGNVYAWMSRELVKEIAGYGSALTDANDLEALPEYTNDPGADLLIDTMRQIRLRGPGPYLSDIPVTKQRVELRDKGCKDVEVYFSQSATIPGALTTVNIGDKLFWHKTHGGHTYVNLEAVVYNGVELPPGYVFRQAEDGGYALLRATGYVFEKPVADTLFGAPMTESYNIPDEEVYMQAAFDEFAVQRNSTGV